MRKTKKKLELAAKPNTRVIFCNAAETKVILDLANNIDKIYKHIRRNVGVSITSNDALKHRKSFLLMAMQIEELVESIAKDINYDISKSPIIQAMINNIEEEVK